MHASEGRILTTHVGSLPGRRDTPDQSEADLRRSVVQVVAQQRDSRVDVINEGEYTKGGDWLSYIEGQLSGFSPNPNPPPALLTGGKDRQVFADFYKYAAERGTLFFHGQGHTSIVRRYQICSGPITYVGQAKIARALDIFRAAVPEGREAFFTTTAPASLEPTYAEGYYQTTEEYLFALAEAMRVEYEMIVDAGFLLQVDDAWLAALWDRIGIPMGLAAFRKYCELRVEALNHALRNIPEEKIRYHLCWGSWHGPHVYDIELKDIVDVMLKIRAQGYSIEGANSRHEHEYHVWETVKLPPGKILIPGVVAHATDVVEHPELVSERIQRYAKLVGPEQVIASTDCGFGERSHPQIAWAKLHALADGAALASKALFR